MANICHNSGATQRRPFWTTQPSACGEVSDSCGASCSQPGFVLLVTDTGTTVATGGWITSLILNILNTDKRVQDSQCGVNPASVKGHWSESFLRGSALNGGAGPGYRVGTGVRNIDTRRMRVREVEALYQATLQADLAKLVPLGLATSVEVTVSYSGGQRLAADVVVSGPAGAPGTRVALIGHPSGDIGYYWSL